MENDDWIKHLAASDRTSEAPRADIAGRVMSELRAIEANAPRDWQSPIIVAFATLAAGWMVWLAIPAWQGLSSPMTTVSDQLVVVLDAFQ